MAMLSEIEGKFQALRAQGGFDRALAIWQDRYPSISALGNLDELVALCRDPSGGSDNVVASICSEASSGDELAGLLLIWLHLPGLWSVIDRLRVDEPVLALEDLDAELLLGFCRGIRSAASNGHPSATLLNRAFWQARSALTREAKYRSRTEVSDVDDQAVVQSTEPWEVLWQAQEAGVLTDHEAWLVDVNRFLGIPDAEIARELGLRRQSVTKRRRRAEERLRAWILGWEIPTRKSYGAGVPNRDFAMTCVNAGSSDGVRPRTHSSQAKGGVMPSASSEVAGPSTNQMRREQR